MSKILIDEATVKLALEALELNNDEWKSLADSGDSGYWKAEDQDHYQQTNKAITVLREALAEQPAQQEPVAWLQIGLAPFHDGDVIARTTKPTKWNPEWWRFEPLYTTPQPAQQEPVAFIDMSKWPPIRWRDGMVRADVARFDGQGIFFAPQAQPAQRTWVGLTESEKSAALYDKEGMTLDYEDYAEAIEAKLKEKNT